MVWILLGVSLVAMELLELLEVDSWPALVASAISITVVAFVSDLPRQPQLQAAQIPATLLFGAAALIALSLP
ncbi:hypothetical protein [Nonomuraea polychroma]|uniref:hypothetical protein n=1 Tax=Nonomuraea polychroma TaxID=46176 RepID=UPI000FDF12DD|nr:hypothetical protein [Nonomuraea polychroma]